MCLAIAEAGKKGEDLTKAFFRDEYILNHKIGVSILIVFSRCHIDGMNLY